jgi:hypothetical protein
MARPFAGLAIALQAIAKPGQQFPDHRAADLMAHVAQALRNLAQALAGPQQRRLRIAACLRLDQRPQIIDQFGIGFGERLAAAAMPTHAAAVRRVTRRHLVQTAADRAASDPGRAHHRGDTPWTRRDGLGCRKTTPALLVQYRSERLEAQSNRRFVNHPNLVSCDGSPGNPGAQKKLMIHLFPDEA